MHIFVKDKNERTITLDVEANDTIDSVKAKIQDATRIPKYQQVLIFLGQYLQDEMPLSYYGIDDGKSLFIRVALTREDAGFELMVRMSDQDQCINLLGLSIHDTIDAVKGKIQDRTGTPKSIQELTFGHLVLNDTFTLRDYNLRRGDMLVLTGRLGCSLASR